MELRNKLFLLGICALLLTSQVYSLQKAFLYVSLGYGRGWWGWACVTENGMKGVHGSPVDFCGARDCPFEAAMVFGENNCIHEDAANIDLSKTEASPRAGAYGETTHININDDLKLVKSDGNVVGDELCVGDKFTFNKGANIGEYFDDGGHSDTPPVYWVDNVEDMVKKLMDYHNSKTLTCKDITGPPVQEGYVDSLTGVPVYPSLLWKGMNYTNFMGRVVCSLKEKALDASGSVSKQGAYYVVTSPGVIDFNAVFSVECMYYEYGMEGPCTGQMGPSGGSFLTLRLPMVIQARPLEPGETTYTAYVNMHPGIQEVVKRGYGETPIYDVYAHNVIYNSVEDFFRIGNLSLNRTIRIVDSANPKIDLVVYGAEDLKFSEATNLRVIVKNSWDAGISITKVGASVDSRFISCDSDKVPVGGKAECLITVTPRAGQGLIINVDYEFKACGRTRTGSVSTTLMASKVVGFAASAQAYGVDVHGNCENSYYKCSAPDNSGVFAVGYECFNKEDNYYTPTKERFDMRFDLPDLSDAKVMGARLVLIVASVNKVQDVAVFSGDSGWSPVSCTATGDICTRPYCQECASLFDSKGSTQQSVQKVTDSGKVSFDVSEAVKQAYAGKAASLSLQVRGIEDIWQSIGQGSCGAVNDWVRQDVEFYGKGVIGPKLEIDYYTGARAGTDTTTTTTASTTSTTAPTSTTTTPTVPDTGSYPTDTGAYPTDTGAFPTDTGAYPTDTGAFPTDTGAYPTDTGAFPTDTGAYPTDTGSFPTIPGITIPTLPGGGTNTCFDGTPVGQCSTSIRGFRCVSFMGFPMLNWDPTCNGGSSTTTTTPVTTTAPGATTTTTGPTITTTTMSSTTTTPPATTTSSMPSTTTTAPGPDNCQDDKDCVRKHGGCYICPYKGADCVSGSANCASSDDCNAEYGSDWVCIAQCCVPPATTTSTVATTTTSKPSTTTSSSTTTTVAVTTTVLPTTTINPSTTTVIPTTTTTPGECSPAYDPNKWNSDSKTLNCNNCYNYGCDKRTDDYAQPGYASGISIFYSCSSVINGAKADGLQFLGKTESDCTGCTHKVALVVAPGQDFHWYRKDDNGRWSHKQSREPVRDTDESGNKIMNPETADRGVYTSFCGYFCVDKNKIDIEGYNSCPY